MGNVHLNRQQAMTLLKELVANDLVNPDYVNIINSIDKHCQIQIKCDYNRSPIEEFTKEHGLIIEEDNEGKYLVIYEP
ncbi:MAG: hypothetical protein ACLQO7_09055 [Candidatus Bathyarchaeia archaeon]